MNSNCSGKVAHLTYYQAIRASKKLNKTRGNAKANVYRCDICHNWHSGNTMFTKKRLSRHAINEEVGYGEGI